MRFLISLILIFVVFLSSCQIFFMAGVYEELQSKHGTIYVYVSKNGNDTNDGLSVSTPVHSMPRAMEVANNINHSKVVEIRVEVGPYLPMDGLNGGGEGILINRPNLVISGGWDKDFKSNSMNAVSIFDGGTILYHVIRIENTTNIILRNLHILRGKATNSTIPNDRGGGIYIENVSYLTIESNVKISDNEAISGGGLFIRNSTNNTIGGDIFRNSATWGGGINFQNSLGNNITADVHNNTANQRGGGIALYFSPNTTISGSIYGNSALANGGGGVYLQDSDYFTNLGWITNNTAGTNGGGVYMNVPHPNSSFGNVINNLPDNFNL